MPLSVTMATQARTKVSCGPMHNCQQAMRAIRFFLCSVSSSDGVHTILVWFGPKATLPIIVLVFLVAPVAVWHHVHVIVLVARTLWRSDR